MSIDVVGEILAASLKMTGYAMTVVIGTSWTGTAVGAEVMGAAFPMESR